MTNVEIAAAFEEIADLLEVQGANQFRVRAYRNAARTIRELPEALKEIAADPNRKLTDLEGIGKDLAEKINDASGGRRVADAPGTLGRNPRQRARPAPRAGAGAEAGGDPPSRTEDQHPRRTPRGVRVAPHPRPEGLRREDRRPPSWPASTWPARPGSGCSGPTPTSSPRNCWPTCAARRRSRKSSPRAAIAAARRRSATSTSSPSPPTPRKRWTAWPNGAASPRRSPAARRKCRSASPPGSKWTSALCRPSRSGPPCSTSPARNSTTSSFAPWPRSAG